MNNNQLINYLNQYLSETAVLNTKLHNLHWNIVGPFFFGLHEKTDEYYQQILTMYDEVAERIKMLGGFPITDTKQYAEIAAIKDIPSKDYNEKEVITYLINDFEYLLSLTKQVGDLATTLNDLYTIDLMTNYTMFLEKQLWMLKAHLK